MKNIILTHFTIGEEFALHEFDLEYLETKTDNNGVDFNYYRYLGKLNDLVIKEVILAYNCDFLRGVFCFS